MKSYEEMTQSVLSRAKEERAAQKRRNRNIILSAIACVCCLTCAILVGMRLNTPEPQDKMLNDATVSQDKMPSDSTVPSANETIVPEPSDAETVPIPQGTHGITLLSMSEGGSYVQLENDVILPYRAVFRIRDVRGLTDKEIEEVKREERLMAEAALEEVGEYHAATISIGSSSSAVIAVYSIEKIAVFIDDFTLVEDVSITSAGNGTLIRGTSVYDETDGKYPRLYHVTWTPSNEISQRIYKDPTLKPSQFRDTITFTITYKDGTVKIAIVDISFDDEGLAYIVQRGITVK